MKLVLECLRGVHVLREALVIHEVLLRGINFCDYESSY